MREIALLTIALLLAPFAVAQDDGNEREIKAAMQRVKELLRKAEDLQERGSHEDARHLRNQAEELQKEINAAKKRWKSKKKNKKQGGDELHRIMNDLEAGMRALRKLGGHKELLAHLKRVAVNVEEEFAQRNRKREAGKRGGNKEREVAKHQLEVMRACLRALMKYKKKDAADLMEHAIHGLELRLEGRRDEKARDIMGRAPKAGAMVELLMMSSEILADMGKKDMAHAASKLGKQYRKRWEHERKGRERKEMDRRHREGEHRERDGREHMERVLERVKKIEKRLDDLTALLERMLKQRDRDRDR